MSLEPAIPSPTKNGQDKPNSSFVREREFHFDPSEAIRNFLKGCTLNGYPLNLEGNNIRVAAAAMTDSRAMFVPQKTVELKPTTPAAYHHTTAIKYPERGRGSVLDVVRRFLSRNPRQDTTIQANTMVPVHLTRADRKTQILAFVETPASFEVDQNSLPSKDRYYDAGAATTEHFTFQIVDASEDVGYTAVLVYDGLINDELPSGMGGDDFILAAYDGMTIYAGITYDTDTFEITSRYVDVGEPPEDEFGFFAVILGGVEVVDNGDGSTTVNPYNSHCGDIFFTFDFGGFNGKPALKCTPYTNWLELPSE